MRKGCRPCLMLSCLYCSGLNVVLDRKYNAKHCEQHCRHKNLRHLLPAVEGSERKVT